jgi:hypothetical protein
LDNDSRERFCRRSDIELAAPARKSKANAPRNARGGKGRQNGAWRPGPLAWGLIGLAIVAGPVYWFGRPIWANVNRSAPAAAPKPLASDISQPHPATRQLHADIPAEPPKPAKPPHKELASAASSEPAIDRWFMEAYLRCWSPPTKIPPDGDYAAKVRVIHDSNGGLAGAPILVNPPSDPEWRAYADSAVQAVKKCNPLHVPSDFQPRFEEWKKVTLYFAPDSAHD